MSALTLGQSALALLPALAVAVAYLLGVRRMAGSRPELTRGVRIVGRLRVVAFLTGVLVAALVVLPVVDEAADYRLWTHMAQHMALVVLAGPLLAAGSPGVPLLLLLAPHGRRRVSRLRLALRTTPGLRVVTWPVAGWLVSVLGMWVWHLPGPYDAAESRPLLHSAMHATLVLSSWWFWWHVLRAGSRRLPAGIGLLYVLAAMVPSAALGAVLTFAGHPLYSGEAAHDRQVGMNPLTDQQLAGLVMWVPMEAMMLAVVALLVVPWLGPAEEQPTDVVAPPVPAMPDLQAVPR
jgi:putative membrane protein